MTTELNKKPASAEDLMAPMLNKLLYAGTATPVKGKDIQPLLAAHLEYLMSLEASGHLFASGPLLTDEGEISGDGLIIIRADSLGHARHMLENDPFVLAGIRQVKTRPWRLMEGNLGIQVNLSSGTFEIN